MRSFELPMVGRNIPIREAFPDIIDSHGSGLLFQAGAGDLRLIHYKDLLDAPDYDHLIGNVKFEQVEDLVALPAPVRVSQLLTINRPFGFEGESTNLKGIKIASLLSGHEHFSFSYTDPSGGARCSRPGRPAGTPAKQWYHYYPPEQPNSPPPPTCKYCGASIP
ncbi:MAG: hypothetical protein ACLP59_24855 [Bryobacteraceae bacterium]